MYERFNVGVRVGGTADREIAEGADDGGVVRCGPRRGARDAPPLRRIVVEAVAVVLHSHGGQDQRDFSVEHGDDFLNSVGKVVGRNPKDDVAASGRRFLFKAVDSRAAPATLYLLFVFGSFARCTVGVP